MVLFGYLLHQHRIPALIGLAASLLLLAGWMWQASFDELRRTFALSRAPMKLMIAGLLLALAMGMLLRWFQTQTFHPSPLRPFLLISMSIGITEELIFRGYFLGRLAQWWNPLPAVTISAILHSAYKTAIFIPSSPANDLMFLGGITFAFGVLLGHWRIKSNSLWPCILFHALFDLWVYGDRTTPWWVW